MNQNLFSPTTIEKNFFTDSIAASKRGHTYSVKDTYGPRVAKAYINDTKVHDANFEFLTTAL